MSKLLSDFFTVLKDSTFDKVIFRIHTFDIHFKEKSKCFEDCLRLLKVYELYKEDSGFIITANIKNKGNNHKVYASFDALFQDFYESTTKNESSILIIDNLSNDFYYYNFEKGKEWKTEGTQILESFCYHNLELYIPLLKLFRNNRYLSEFDDSIERKILLIENGKEKNFINLSYSIFDKRIFSKQVDFNISEIFQWLEFCNKPNHLEWISSFKHNIVFLLSAQSNINKTFTELFLNVDFVLANTNRDYNIYMSGFSFEKISREFKLEKRKYFEDLNQAQDKIKSQVIAVPLSIGTSIYAFFQMTAELRTYYFILGMVGVYIFFICWYLLLYDKDLKKLKSDIKEETEKFEKNYPNIFNIFKPDFVYIVKKVNSVLILSWVIKIVIFLDWIILLIYVCLVIKNPMIPKDDFYFKISWLIKNNTVLTL